MAQIVPAYIGYTSTLEQRLNASIYYVLDVEGVPLRMRVPGRNLASLRRPYAVLLAGAYDGFWGYYGPLGAHRYLQTMSVALRSLWHRITS